MNHLKMLKGDISVVNQCAYLYLQIMRLKSYYQWMLTDPYILLKTMKVHLFRQEIGHI